MMLVLLPHLAEEHMTKRVNKKSHFWSNFAYLIFTLIHKAPPITCNRRQFQTQRLFFFFFFFFK